MFYRVSEDNGIGNSLKKENGIIVLKSDIAANEKSRLESEFHFLKIFYYVNFKKADFFSVLGQICFFNKIRMRFILPY